MGRPSSSFTVDINKLKLVHAMSRSHLSGTLWQPKNGRPGKILAICLRSKQKVNTFKSSTLLLQDGEIKIGKQTMRQPTSTLQDAHGYGKNDNENIKKTDLCYSVIFVIS